MKKSLNNRIRGKRLVMGDENEVTKNEILIQDKDDKIIVKQRGATGEMENISGGEESTDVVFYCTGSGTYNLGHTAFTTLKDFLALDFKSTSNYAGTRYSAKQVVFPLTASSNNVTLEYIKQPSQNSEIVTITVKDPENKIVTVNDWEIAGYLCMKKYSDVTSPITELSTFGVDNPIIYDPASNILFYYTTLSNCIVKIYPEELAKTLKIYCLIHLNHLYVPNGVVVNYIEDHV